MDSIEEHMIYLKQLLEQSKGRNYKIQIEVYGKVNYLNL
jgi:hypothetical protein